MTRKTSAAAAELAPATISEADGVRYLHLGTPWVQGAMRLRKPQAIELEYVQRMMAWMLWRPMPQLMHGHAVQLGLGAAAITRFCHGVLKMRTTAVELNPTVIAACRLWFRLPDDGARLRVIEGDAGRFAADPSNADIADVLCVDLYDHEAAAPVLDSAIFYRDCHRLLADEGVMSVNLFGRDASFERSTQRIVAAFGESRVRTLRPTKEGNTVVIAWKGGEMPDRDELAARCENIETRFGLPARKWLRMIRTLPATADHP
ncbi:MAG TPA: spermidine synthase [Albitalea sp.]|nr:spermidine synthase [Albitalea sp.]